MRFFVLFFALASFAFTASAQSSTGPDSLTDKQWDELFDKLANERWKEAFDLSSGYITRLKNDDSADSIGNLRYILIYSAAGAVSVGDLSYDDLEKELPKVVGKKIVTPFRPLGIECQPPMFNHICGSKEKGDSDAMTTATNRQATSILAFEYIKLADRFNFSKHKGKPAAVVGIANEIVPNPNRSNIVIVRIYIEKAEILLRSEIERKK